MSFQLFVLRRSFTLAYSVIRNSRLSVVSLLAILSGNMVNITENVWKRGLS